LWKKKKLLIVVAAVVVDVSEVAEDVVVDLGT
jgi:hypothetical protein